MKVLNQFSSKAKAYSTSFLAAACVNLTGQWYGPCEYNSQTYGHLAGELEMKIEQTNCDQISFDGSSLQIPGSIKQTVNFETEIQTTELMASWPLDNKSKLNYTYKYQAEKKHVVIDDVLLEGQLSLENSKLIVIQKGHVDHDQVQITCQLSQ